MRTIAIVSLSLFAACGDNLGPSVGADAEPGTATPKAIVVAGDFQATGVLSVVDVTEQSVRVAAVAGVVGPDPVLRHVGDEYVIINRLGGDNVTILDRNLQLVEQLGTGASSNPQDAVVVGGKVFVAALASPDLLVMDRGSNRPPRRVSLATLDSVDGFPDCVAVTAVENKVFVACGQLDRDFKPRGPGQIAVVDAETERVLSTFSLASANPIGLWTRSPAASVYGGDLLIATVPDYANLALGCVERVSTDNSPASKGCAITNQALGAYANHLEVTDEALWVAATGFDASFNPFGSLRHVSLDTGMLTATTASAAAQVVVDVAACSNGQVVVSDRAPVNGIRIYGATGEVTTEPLPIGMRPGTGNNIVCD